MLETWSGVERHLYKGDPNDEYEVLHWCVKCVAEKRNISENAALVYILEHRPGHQRRVFMNTEYNRAMTNRMQSFEGYSRKELCILARQDLAMVLSPGTVHCQEAERA